MNPISLMLLFLPLTTLAALTAPLDLLALKQFKSSIAPSSVQPWSCLSSWDFSAADPCASPRLTHFICGVECYASRVTAITLDPAGYSGELTPALSALTALTHLDLSDNAFHGAIPATLASLVSLRTLTLNSNSLSGPLPTSLPPNLVSLDVSNNHLSGPLPDYAFSKLTSLRVLDLSFNSISGSIPKTLPKGLFELAIRGNRISGVLQKPTFTPLKYLEVVELGSNAIEGKLENWFFLLPSLQQVNLANNSLTGFAPKGAEKSSRILALDLTYNTIEGYLPVEFASFRYLAALLLSHNRLKGAIPEEYSRAKKGSPFRRLFLDGNFLNGKVPSGFLSGAEFFGSFADNCLEACPVNVQLCKPSQKPVETCRQVYGLGSGRHRPARSLLSSPVSDLSRRYGLVQS